MRCGIRDGETDALYSLWIDRAARILSFAEAEGFDRVRFKDYDQMMDCAIRISRSGYRIQ